MHPDQLQAALRHAQQVKASLSPEALWEVKATVQELLKMREASIFQKQGRFYLCTKGGWVFSLPTADPDEALLLAWEMVNQ